jgi:predicted nuclease of restriction endonuclease-like (RecB) superfamily
VTELSWTNNLVILARTATELEREFYLKLSIEKKYSKRELERAISTSTFERTVLTEVKPAPVMPANHIELSAHFKDTYVFDFLKLPEDYTEKSLRKSIIKNLREFILELGGDFTFVAEEYRIQVGNSDFFIDLLFYHRGLRCLVPLELKVDKFRPEFISKMSFYLEALDRQIRKQHENPSVGIILCRDCDPEIVGYAQSRDMSPTKVAEYKTQLIEKTKIQAKVNELFNRRSQLKGKEISADVQESWDVCT